MRGRLRYWPLTGTAIAALGTMGFYAQGWRYSAVHCYFQSSFGFIGPGCGLTRSILALGQGNLALALRYHLFGPVLVLALVGLLGWGIANLLFPTRLMAVGQNKGFTLGWLAITVGNALAFLAYYGLRLLARYADDALPDALHHLPLWSFLVSSAHLI